MALATRRVAKFFQNFFYTLEQHFGNIAEMRIFPRGIEPEVTLFLEDGGKTSISMAGMDEDEILLCVETLRFLYNQEVFDVPVREVNMYRDEEEEWKRWWEEEVD